MVGPSIKFGNEHKKYSEIGMSRFVFPAESQQINAITNEKETSASVTKKLVINENNCRKNHLNK